MKKTLTIFLIFFMSIASGWAQITYYVKSNGNDTNNGRSWVFAFQTVQQAMDAATSGDRIFVAAGTYKPTVKAATTSNNGAATTNRDMAFVIKSGVKIYGGFNGTENSLAQRNLVTNVTILSGDVDIAENASDNCYHVVIAAGEVSGGGFDGFTITGGNANVSGDTIIVNGQRIPQCNGGGAYISSSSPMLVNITFNENSATNLGGGAYSENSSSSINNATFKGNKALSGGGAYLNGKSPNFAGATFINNTAGKGGGLFLEGTNPNVVNVTNATISGNSAEFGAGIYLVNASPNIINTLISGNDATDMSASGGGIYSAEDATPVLTNVTISGNKSKSEAGAVYFKHKPIFRNSIIWGNSSGVVNGGSETATYLHCLVQDRNETSDGCINAIAIGDKAVFVEQINHTAAPTINGDYRLAAGSLLFNRGNNSYNNTTNDLGGKPRISAEIIDLGAYEWWREMTTLYVNSNSIGINNGYSWTDAFTSLQSALEVAFEGDQIWVAAGIYKPSAKVGNGADIRDMAFLLRKNVKIYGGFVGNETSLNQRNWETNITTLSGDIGVEGNSADNCYHVVVSIDNMEEACLNGFIIRDGNANGNRSIAINGLSVYEYYGGGVYCYRSSPVLTNLIISNNTTKMQGGGMFNSYSTPVLTNVTIEKNRAIYGGGIYNDNSSPTLINVIIGGNLATQDGGGIENKASSPVLTNVIISGNVARNLGGGIDNYNSSSPVLVNTTISGNMASENGGGVYNDGSSSPLFRNTIVWGNNTGVYTENMDTLLIYQNCLVQDRNETDNHCISAVGIAEEGVFAELVKATEGTPTTEGDYSMKVGSPCINTGNNSYNSQSTDCAGRPRINQETIDMGAYEYHILYTITFYSNEGTPISPRTVAVGTAIGDIYCVRIGYTLEGWYTEENFANKWNVETDSVNSDLNLYAKWDTIYYTVSFESNGGTVIAPATIAHGATLTEPAQPTKIGHTFAGWYKEATFVTLCHFANDTILQDRVLYAKWTINSYTVTFESNGGTKFNSVSTRYGTTIAEPTQPTKTGHIFGGWYKEINFTTLWSFADDTVSSDIMLYAKWTAISYTVSFDSDGGSTIASIPADYSTKITSPTPPTKTGYTFNNWYKEKGCITLWDFANDTITGNITLYAKWTAINYTMSFESNGGSVVSAIISAYGTTVIEPTSPVKTGYVFKGWYKETTLTTPWIFATDMMTEEVTLYAKWEVVTGLVVTFESNGGTAVAPIATNYGTTIAVPVPPVKAGHTFVGWFQEAALTTSWNFTSNMVEDDMTLYAKWTVINYTVTFESNGGTAIAPVSITYGTLINEPTLPSKTGYNFVRWYKDIDCVYAWNFGTDQVLGNTTLYAQWKAINYTVTFESNGGTAVAPMSADYGTTITEPVSPQKMGYTFAGWYKEIALSTPWNFTVDTVTGNNILYAKWSANSYTVSFESNGGTTVNPISVDYNTTIIEPTAPNKTGHTFAGWYKEPTLATRWNFATDLVLGNTTLYAKWTAINYTVTFESNGGTTVNQIMAAYGTLIAEPVSPGKLGYTFAGWYKEGALATLWNFASDVVVGNITLYAKWTILEYTVTFECSGGTAVSPISATHGATITEPTPPVRTGFIFRGWFKEMSLTNVWDFINDVVLSDITLYANWVKDNDAVSELNPITVQFYPNPVQTNLYIQSSSIIEQIIIYDLNGRALRQIIHPEQFIEVGNLANGVYLVKIQTADGILVRKVVKN